MSQDPAPTDFTPPEIGEIADLLPTYEILSFIAKGGMGAVYRARQKSLDRDVAIKVLPRHFGEDAQFRASFEAEAKSMAKFNHPNLIGIYDFGQVDGLLYIIMEMVHGKSLYDFSYGKTIDPSEAARIVSGTLRGLASAHSHGLLHRDIKPANILLDAQDSPKIGDFGLARPIGDHEADSAFGTPGYTAPEVVQNPAAVDQSTDIYAVGIMLYELLTGKLPERVYTPASSLVQCDPRFDQVIRKATHPTPAMRYRRAEDAADALDAIRDNMQSTPKLLVQPPAAPAKPVEKHRLVTRELTPPPAKLNTEVAAGNRAAKAKPPTAAAPPTPAPAVAVGSNVPFIRNIIIIIGLLAAIYVAWESLKVVRANRAAEQAEEDAKKKAQQEEITLRKNQAAADQTAAARPPARQKPVARLPDPEPKAETPRETLARLRPKLLRGERTEMPKGSFTRDGRTRMLITDPMAWHQAREFCEQHGGHLAVLPDPSDLQWLCSKLKSDQTVWLGAGSAGNNQWRWIDGTPWKQNIRRTSKASYVAVDDTGILMPQPASDRHIFFIEWLMDGTTPASLDNQLKRCAASLGAVQPEFPAGSVSYDNRRYLLIRQDVDWEAARAMAETGGGTLAVPSNADENIWLLGFITSQIQKGQACWIGGFRPAGKPWQWVTGEPWSFGKWAEGSPDEDAETIAGCAVRPDEAWYDYAVDTPLSHFLIEWSKDGEGLERAKTSGAPEDRLTPVRRKCAELIKGIQKDFAKQFTTNIKGYEQELRVYLRGLPKSVAEAQTPGVAAMTSQYPENRIPANIPRENMPGQVLEILDSRLGKQTRIQTKFLAEVEALRVKYRSNLSNSLKELEQKGLKSRARRIQDELDSTAKDAQGFVDYILGAG